MFNCRPIPAKRIPTRALSLVRSNYFAVIVGADSSHCHVISLGSAAAVDTLIARYRISLGVMTAADRDRQGEVTQASAELVANDARSAITAAARSLTAGLQPHDEDKATAHRIQEAIFSPLLSYLPGCTQLAIVPDGELARLPLNVLPLGSDSRVIDDFEISNLSSARDLLRSTPPGRANAALVVGDPDFDLNSQGLDPLNYPFSRLDGTREEMQTVASFLGVDAIAGSKAIVSCVTEAVSPLVLHLATHACAWDFGGDGQQLNRFDPSNKTNPLLRSGLILAGANTWLTGGSPAANAGYGMLFAQEVLGMDFRGTELVVLSACETGLGHVFSGEGVFGLGRAFAIAGARAVVMSLWRIPDQATSALMKEFYRALSGGLGRARALREAQLRLK